MAIKSATFNEKIMAIPSTGSSLNTSNVLWIRKDWLDKLGLQPPKTMDDVKKIAEAFTKRDPDGNGEADTFGLGITKTLWGSSPNLEGFFNGYHAYPTIWVKDASGKLVYGAVQSQSKQALADLQTMYKAGFIDPEFGVKDDTQVNESINANKIGMFFGKMHSPVFFGNTASKDPNIQWQSYPLPSIDSTSASTQQDFPVKNYYVVRKGYEHPEAVVKVLNLDEEILRTSDSDIHKRLYPKVVEADLAVGGPIMSLELPLKNLNQYLNINKAISAKNESLLTTDEERTNYKAVLDYMTTKNPEGYVGWAIIGPEGPFRVLNDYLTGKKYILSEFYGAATPTMVTKDSTLAKLVLEQFTKIIVGNAPIDEFDKFVQDWNKLGGEQITKEVNDWNSSR